MLIIIVDFDCEGSGERGRDGRLRNEIREMENVVMGMVKKD